MHWQHDPSVCFLNHGSFGGAPTRVLHAQTRLRNRMEAEPIRFFVEDLWSLTDAARHALAGFVGADEADLVPVPNATVGVTTVLHHLARTGALGAGDEIVANDHEYPACLNNLRDVCAMTGATVVMAKIPFPIASPDEAYDAIMARVTPRTKAVLVSHATSSSGLILPLERLVRDLEQRGIRTIVDGAHGVGFIENLNLNALGASYYTSNCHKWLCTPKGSAFLWIRPDRQRGFRPMVLSNFAEKAKPGRPALHTEFDFVGTNDTTAFLTIPDAIDFMGGVMEESAGWPGVHAHNRGLVREARDLLCRELGMAPTAPDEMLGNLCTLILPAHEDRVRARLAGRPSRYHDALQDALLERWRIQVPIWSVADGPRTIRISAQVYNSIGQYAYLAHALKAELARERDAS